jgi:hypothetical protein
MGVMEGKGVIVANRILVASDTGEGEIVGVCVSVGLTAVAAGACGAMVGRLVGGCVWLQARAIKTTARPAEMIREFFIEVSLPSWYYTHRAGKRT